MKLTILKNGTLSTNTLMDDLYILIMVLTLINLSHYRTDGIILQSMILIVSWMKTLVVIVIISMIHYILKIVLNYKIVICFSILYIIDEHTAAYGIDLSRTNETLTDTSIIQCIDIDTFESHDTELSSIIHLFNETNYNKIIFLTIVYLNYSIVISDFYTYGKMTLIQTTTGNNEQALYHICQIPFIWISNITAHSFTIRIQFTRISIMVNMR